jgi:hypothetical protein
VGCNDADIYLIKAVMFRSYALLGFSDSIKICIHKTLFHEEDSALLAVSLLDMG